MDYSKLSREELITLLQLREQPVAVREPVSVYDYLRPYGNEEQEHFFVVMLDGAHRIKHVKVVSIGLVNRTLVHPREIFAPAIEIRATAIIIAHNHPSGNLEPSADDLEVTHRIKKAGQLLGIELLDHLIFSSTDYRSLAETGELL
jgi:DNA repair protein RadC